MQCKVDIVVGSLGKALFVNPNIFSVPPPPTSHKMCSIMHMYCTNLKSQTLSLVLSWSHPLPQKMFDYKWTNSK